MAQMLSRPSGACNALFKFSVVVRDRGHAAKPRTMCLCGFVCVPLIAFIGAGIAGVGAPAVIAEAERAKKASEAEGGDGGDGDGGSSELQELCSANCEKGRIMLETPLPKNEGGMCLLCYGMQNECGCEEEVNPRPVEEEDESSPAPKGPCELCHGASCGCRKTVTL